MKITHAVGPDALATAKWAFTTRRVDRADIETMRQDFETAKPGDLVLGRVARIGSHKRIQLPSGRPSQLYLDDLVIMACGARYATDQFEGVAELPRQGAHMLAGGGVLGRMRAQNGRMANPTQIIPLGLLAERGGRVCNTADYALPPEPRTADLPVIGVIGGAMNAGKTTAVASLVHGLGRAGLRVAAIKATGTGAYGDYNAYRDAGAGFVADFVDAGMASTYMEPLPRIIAGMEKLLGHAGAAGCQVAVVELADGILQRETGALLDDPGFRARFDGWIYAASDAMSAIGGVAPLARMGISPAVLSGKVTAAPMAMQEVASSIDIPLATRDELQDPALATAILTGIMAPDSRDRAGMGTAAA